jgi:putative transcriptional regulator
MKAVFVELPAFDRHRAEYLDDDGFSAFQRELMRNPAAGKVIEGTGGLRKMRFANKRRGKGKQGGLRDGRSHASAAQGAQGDDQNGTGIEENDMKASVKAKRAPKRDLFAELSEGMEALAQAREGKRTLRTHAVEFKPAPRVTPAELVRVRERLKLSRALFAVYLRTNVRTLENWEQGRARPNAQAALLINLVRQYPDTVQRLAAI